MHGNAVTMLGSVVSRSDSRAATLRGSVASRAAVTPVEKVTELLAKLREQVQEEGAAEAAGYDKYACFCKESADNKQYAIEKSDAEIEALQAEVQDLTGEINQLANDLQSLLGDIDSEEDAATAAREAHENASAAHQVARQNLTDGISAITEAVEALRSSRDSLSSARAAEAFAQVLALNSASAEQAPKPYAYRSKEVLATLQTLLATFKSKLVELDEAWGAEAHQHNMVEGARANKIAALKATVLKKEKLSAEKTAEKSKHETALQEEQAARTADQAFLDELKAGCEAKAQAWDERSQTRAAEITKLTEAMEALKEVSSLYSVNKKLTGLVLKNSRISRAPASTTNASSASAVVQGVQARKPKPAQSFLQLGSRQDKGSRARNSEKQRLVTFLEQHAQALKSASLARVAAFARLAADPFARVRALINDLIAKLEAEASSEATHKDFCDTGMSAAVTKRDERKAEMEGLETSIAASNAAIKQHAATIAELAAEIAALQKELLELTTLRTEESAQNNKTIAEADEGKEAVDQAISILEGFYGPAFVQMRRGEYTPPNADRFGDTVSDLAPETFSGNYTGRVDASKGVIGLLQVISSDFERTSTAVAAAEAEAESAYQAEKGELEDAIADDTQRKEGEETSKSDQEDDLVGFQDSLKSTTELHDSALADLETLKTGCIDSATSHEERRRQREQEIEALKEAHRILEEWQG